MKLDASDLKDLQPVIDAAVRATMAQIDADRDRLGYPEPEAAALCGVARHVLRDARLRGEIQARKLGAKIVYSRAALLTFLGGTP